MKAYKAAKKNRISQFGDVYEVGKTYFTNEKPEPGVSGFHFL